MKRKGKKSFSLITIILLIFCLSVSAMAADIELTNLSDTELEQLIEEARAELAARRKDFSSHETVTIKPSPDKYTWYVQDYVGRNAASFGYTSLGGDRLDRYGSGYAEFTFVSEDGRYIDIEDEDELKQYVVTGQNIQPNTEMKLIFRTDSDGNEYSSLIDYQSVRNIDLSVQRLDGTVAGDVVYFDLIPIQTSPDKYTWYIRNYVGKNVASFGYTSLGGNRLDEYGNARLRLNFVADDGTYLDPEDENLLRKYVVVSQDIEPNSEMKLTFRTDSQGNEYSNLIDNQTYEGITLRVRRLNLDLPEPETETLTVSSESIPTDTSDNRAGTQEASGEIPAAAPDGKIYVYRDIQYILLEDGSAEVCGVNGQKNVVTIPSEADGHTISRIGDHAFEGCTWIDDFIIWASPVSIGTCAFKDCTSIEDISISSSVKTIGESAFEGCTSLETVILWADPERIERNTFRNCTRLTDFSVPSSVKVIGESAFEGCTNMDTVILWGAPTIENSAFRNCTSLTDISISSGTDSIGDHAFDGCTSLETVILWGSSTKIGEDAFANCPNLTDILQ